MKTAYDYLKPEIEQELQTQRVEFPTVVGHLIESLKSYDDLLSVTLRDLMLLRMYTNGDDMNYHNYFDI